MGGGKLLLKTKGEFDQEGGPLNQYLYTALQKNKHNQTDDCNYQVVTNICFVSKVGRVWARII